MKFKRLLVKVVLLAAFLPLTASALIMRANGPEPIIVQIKESLRISDDLDTRLNELATARQQNGMGVVKWWAGRRLLVMLSFPSNFTQQQAMRVITKLEQLAAVEKVVPVSGYNLEFKSGDFVRGYEPSDAIPDVARRGFDADRIGKSYPAPDPLGLARTPHAPNRFIVRWKEELIWKADQTRFSQRLADFHRGSGCRVVNEFRYSPTQLTQVVEFDDPATLADKLKRYMDTGWAVYVQPDYLYQATAVPGDPAYAGYPGPQWSLANISAPQAWDLTIGDPSVILAVGDTGANVNHPEFSSNLWWGQTDSSTGNHNFISNSANVDDDYAPYYHGSNVASIIGAQGNNGTAMTGVAWDTSLMILKVVNSSGGASSSTVATAIGYARQHGATAINLSLGFRSTYCRAVGQGEYECYDGGDDPSLLAALKAARDHNMVVVSAAGNDNGLRLLNGTEAGNNDDDINSVSPTSIPTDNNISVLATDRSDNIAGYSSYGTYRVDLGAPGGTSADPIIGLKQTFNGNSFDSSNYSFLAGTSMAAPHVTGALGLIKSRFPWEDYRGIRDRILMGTDRTGTLEGLCRTNGRLNVYKAMQTRSMLRNLSSRARVEGGDRVLIGGFNIGGSATGGALKVAIRGLGPSVGVTVPRLNNPQIDIYGPNGYHEANIDWQQDGNAWDLQANGLAPSDSREAAMVRWLPQGSYSVIVSSEDGQYGVGMFEIYELQGNTNEQSRLLNLSPRCIVGTGEEEPIAGAIIGDQNNTGLPKPDRRVLIFGKGPTVPVAGALQDPQIQVLTTGDYSNNWGELYGPLQEELGEAGLLPIDGRESALWPTWQPGNYAVKLNGTYGSTGIGLLEIYEY